MVFKKIIWVWIKKIDSRVAKLIASNSTTLASLHGYRTMMVDIAILAHKVCA